MGGYYGMRNVGDDVLLYVTIGEVNRLDRDAAFTVISSVPQVTPPGARVAVRPADK
jgi:polysaccharide pyruvyl transferase WcaK-like protein